MEVAIAFTRPYVRVELARRRAISEEVLINPCTRRRLYKEFLVIPRGRYQRFTQQMPDGRLLPCPSTSALAFY
ncbi:3766_t:CDS:2, partial [Acaulospora colombiana]